MVLQTRPLLLLTLSLGLACAQKTLEQVPVQPGFDAQKVAVLLRAQTWLWDEDTGASVACRLHSGTGRQPTKGQRWGSGEGVSGPGTASGLWTKRDPEPVLPCVTPPVRQHHRGGCACCWGLGAETGGSGRCKTPSHPSACTPAGRGPLADRPAGRQPRAPGIPSRPPEARSAFHLDPGRRPAVRLVLDVSGGPGRLAGCSGVGPPKGQ